MANFRNKLQSYKSGTGLAKGSSEELQSLTKAAERSIAPQSPLEASVIGSSPDVAKMAGTPAQKTSSLRVALQQSKSLPDTERTAQSRGGTAEEQAQIGKSQQTGKLSGLPDRVQALATQLMSPADTAASQLQLNPEALNMFPPESQPQAEELLLKLSQNQATNQDILTLNQLLGRSVNDMLSADEIKANFLSAAETIGQDLAAATPDQITMDTVDPVTLGFTDMTELASILGIDETALSEMSLADLQEEAQKLITEEFTKVNQLQALAEDPNLGPAERAEARKNLRDMGAVGIRQAETEMDKLADQIVNADEVTFNNENISIKDMLNDEFISGVVAKYVNSDETDPFREELEANEPELVEWINQNKAALEMAASDIDEDVQNFAAIQQTNNNLKNVQGGEPLSDDIMKRILPDWGQLRADEYNIAELPSFVQFLHNEAMDKNAQIHLREAVDSLYNTDPTLIDQLSQMSEQDLRNFGLTVKPDPKDPRYQKFEQYKTYLDNYKRIQAMTNDPTDIASAVFGHGASWADLQNLVKESRGRELFTEFGKSPLAPILSALDSNKDGKLDSPAKIAQALKNMTAPGQSVIGLMSAMQKMPTSPSSVAQATAQYNKTVNPLYNKVKKYVMDSKTPGVLDSTEVKALSKVLNPAELQALWNNKMPKTGTAKKALIEAYRPYFKPAELTKGRYKDLLKASHNLLVKSNSSKPRTDQAYIPSEALKSQWSQSTYNELKAMEKTMKARYNAAKGVEKELWEEMYYKIRNQKNEYGALIKPVKSDLKKAYKKATASNKVNNPTAAPIYE